MTIALHGNLLDFGIGEVFQLIGQQRKTGVLEVRGAEDEVALWFDAGRVVTAAPVSERPDAALFEMLVRCGVAPRDKVAALQEADGAAPARASKLVADAVVTSEALVEIEDLLTRETIFELLHWENGSFRFVAQPISHERPQASLLGAEQVLMDGLRMVDEWRAFAADRPDDHVVYRRRGSFEEYRRSPAGAAAPSRADAERVFLLVDGRSTVRRVIDLSRLGSFRAVRTLVHLARAGWVQPVQRSHAPETGPATLAPVSERRRRIALVAPLVALALVAGLALGVGAPVGPDLAASEAALAGARTRAEAMRIRRLAFGHRLNEGRWPATLDELADWSGDVSLTREERAPYYLAHRDQGALLLAADPTSGRSPAGHRGP